MSSLQRQKVDVYVGRIYFPDDRATPHVAPFWAQIGMLVIFAAVAFIMISQNHPLTWGLFGASLVSAALGAWTTRAVLPMSHGKVIAEVMPGSIFIRSTRVAAVAGALIAATLTPSIDLGRYSLGYILVFGYGLVVGLRAVIMAVRSNNVRIDETGVSLRGLSTQHVTWEDMGGVVGTDTKLMIGTSKGPVVGYVPLLRSDPTIVAEIISRASEDRTLLHRDFSAEMAAEDRWRRN